MGQLQTRNVLVNFNDVPDGQVRAQAIVRSCESDIIKLNALFRVRYDADSLNTAGLRVSVISPPSGGASNTGWHGILVPSSMEIKGDYMPGTPSLQTATIRDEFTCFLFVAELTEIYMDIVPGRWNRGFSDGEALSILLATELHPLGYYGSASGPRVNQWLQSDRQDFVSNTDLTDKNELSYGCGLLFLNYLRHQMGFDLADIIAARPTQFLMFGLADRYATLTGKPAAQAFPEFMTFLDHFLPRTSAALGWVGRDDIFPLRGPGQRAVHMSTESLQLGSNRIEPAQHVSMQAGPLCGAKPYGFWPTEVSTQVTASALGSGFAAASFRWSINGVELGPNSSPLLEITADVVVPKPDRTTDTNVAATVRVSYALTASWNRGTLVINNIDHAGTYQLKIGVVAHETLVSDGDASVAQTAELPSFHFEYDHIFSDDQRLCNADLVQVSAELLKLTQQVQLVLDAPDPQPNLRVGAILDAARRVNAAIDGAAANMGAAGPVFLRELSRGARISQEVSSAQGRLVHAKQENVFPTTLYTPVRGGGNP